jgi:YVTN family beta-propeller protein
VLDARFRKSPRAHRVTFAAVQIVRRLFLGSAAFILASSGGIATHRVAASPQAASCSVTFAPPLFTALAGTLGGIVIDKACQHVYLTNTTQNRVEDFSLQSLTLNAPIQVGSLPVGLDLTPDGSLLYVANSGGNNISVVDLAQRVELRKITIPSSTTANDTPYSIAIASNGLALFSTTFSGSGFGARMMQLNLATDQVAQRTDFYFFGSTTERTLLNASGDRTVVGIVAGDISSGPVFRYGAGTNTFSGPKNLNSFISGVSLDRTGSTLMVTPGTYVLDAALNLSGTIPGSGWGGSAADPTGSVGYRSVASRVDILNLRTFLKTGELPLGDSVDFAYFTNFVGHMDLSADGRLLAVITDHGFALVRRPAFSDEPLVAGITPIKAVHFTELRTRIDTLRAAYGLPAYPYTDPTLTTGVTVVQAQHLLDLRIALSQAYVEAGLTPPTYTDPGLGPGTIIKVAHIVELRAAVIALE